MVTDDTIIDMEPVRVRTPATHWTSYDPDWRHRLAAHALAGAPSRVLARLPAMYRTDKILRKHMSFWERLRQLRNGDRRSGANEFLRNYPGHTLAFHAWQLSAFSPDTELRATQGAFLDAMLLTDASLEDISEALQIAVPVLRLYEAIYFNVREAGGVMKLSPARKVGIALDGDVTLRAGASRGVVLRYIGALVGFSGLMVFTGLADARNLDVVEATRALLLRTLMQQLATRVVTGDAKVQDMSKMLETLLKDDRDKEANQINASNTVVQQREMLTGLLGMLRPQIATMATEQAAAEALGSYIGVPHDADAHPDDPFFEVDEHISNRLGTAANQLQKGANP